MTLPITKEIDVLLHTQRTGRYVTDEQFVIEMAAKGLLKDYGPQRLAGGMHYLTITDVDGKTQTDSIVPMALLSTHPGIENV
jgi:hypothetical protein